VSTRTQKCLQRAFAGEENDIRMIICSVFDDVGHDFASFHKFFRDRGVDHDGFIVARGGTPVNPIFRKNGNFNQKDTALN
jgi:hypothetical protein